MIYRIIITIKSYRSGNEIAEAITALDYLMGPQLKDESGQNLLNDFYIFKTMDSKVESPRLFDPILGIIVDNNATPAKEISEEFSSKTEEDWTSHL